MLFINENPMQTIVMNVQNFYHYSLSLGIILFYKKKALPKGQGLKILLSINRNKLKE